MSYVTSVVTFLSADATLAAILTGGIYDFSAAGRKGLNRLQLPGAYDDTTGFVKPVALLAEMDQFMDEEAVSPNTGYFSVQSPLYIRILDHGDKGYATIATASDRIKVLLNCKPQIITNAFQLIWKKTLKDRREPNLLDACYFQELYQVHGWIS